VLADLDGDGKKEILFPSYDGKVHAYWLDRTEHGSWPYDVPGTGIRFASEPAVADLDGDGHAEVLFTSWPQKSVGGTGQLHVLDDLGNLLHSVGLPAPFGGATWNGALGAPTLADVDGDGELEAVVGTVASGVVVYDLPGSGNARVLWGTGRGGSRRTGAAPGPSGPPLASRFHTITPCRVIDTRLPAGPLGGPSLAAGARRLLPLNGTCGIPPGASVLSANVTVVAGGTAGFLVLWAGDGELPGTSNLNFGAGRVRANNAVIELARDGTRTIWVKSSSAAPVDVILDVNGYFE
ncbi:MAG TPA: VCBS repeat-containing protein, partial [Thermoanaerobaculia bacterium]|nr:VCBS repeat-containing protein [Thermoanaerobaculia bacterium]